MNLELAQVGDGVFATNRAAMQAEVADVIVFDMDGVLINVHGSYPVVICQTVTAYLHEQGFVGDELAVTPDETAYFKAAGGFNSDWALSQGLVLVFLVKAVMAGSREIAGLRHVDPSFLSLSRAVAQQGGGLEGLSRALQGLVDEKDFEDILQRWDRKRISQLAMEYYAGDEMLEVFGVPNETVKGQGLMHQEHALISREELLRAPFRYGLYTGRNFGEAQMAMRASGLEGIWTPEAMMTEDRGVHKPDPQGLVNIARALSPRLMIYVGDNLDDWQAASRYEAERSLDDPPCLFCGMLNGSPGPMAYGLFQERGVDLMAHSVSQLLTWLTRRRQRTA
ncbi:MAG: haloacid dehalogenase [Sulfobacillus thermosulfidooxidans]|uniref:Haloacid dehalogenase n=1 Tax=Sulfobacillus thermotolerans TaxID=338644 RepID=A0ABN5GXD9_9FIRM|nr:HAD-IA family hydrolase [Sulfobacillus sp. hq2]AUW93035.1 haloacid dehalogenase [Sulfobacillus thermotolerans]MCY0908483.1 HAD-IA family hydrolase [Sulfobacillus thermotolerans]POB11098.1 haloacid dehalogenase [Sulfobacillus sp. hq2]PSR38128.1 MAG: haloacid dehalogenase [Sulfobacillus thermosulfidooxidans]